MSGEALELCLRLALELPVTDIEELSRASAEGAVGLGRMRSRAGSPALRSACGALMGQIETCSPAFLAGALAGSAAALEHQHREQSIEVVWTGPESGVDTGRLTAAVVADLIDSARSELLLVSYATQSEPRIADALLASIDRGVDVTCLLERNADNAAFSGSGHAFGGLGVRRLSWPMANRPAGGALHAKVIVVDAEAALVGSANITGRAMESNLECGILIRGGPQPVAIREHIWNLVHRGVLEQVPTAI